MATKEEELEKLLEGIDFKNLTAEQITGENEDKVAPRGLRSICLRQKTSFANTN